MAGARYPGHVITTGDGILTITATNMSDLNLANASVSNGIVVSGSGNTITIGANTKTIDFATTPAAVGSNNLKVVETRFLTLKGLKRRLLVELLYRRPIY